jgi:hypothetical protein
MFIGGGRGNSYGIAASSSHQIIAKIVSFLELHSFLKDDHGRKQEKSHRTSGFTSASSRAG